MTEDEVIDLLSIITAYDKRSTGQGEVHAWFDAAQRGRWTFVEASEAVKAHYAESAAWLMPGHITDRIRAERSEPPQSHALPQATPSPAGREHVDRCVAWLSRRMAENNARPSPTNRRMASAIPCPLCGAKADRRCWQTTSNGIPLASGKTMEEPHRDRITAAQAQE